jgi:hypothetical protein
MAGSLVAANRASRHLGGLVVENHHSLGRNRAEGVRLSAIVGKLDLEYIGGKLLNDGSDLAANQSSIG